VLPPVVRPTLFPPTDENADPSGLWCEEVCGVEIVGFFGGEARVGRTGAAVAGDGDDVDCGGGYGRACR
jgi:hypothetical protein